MVNYKEIIRLASEGTSQRQIAVSVGHSRDNVSEFLTAAKAHNLTWPLDESVTNEQIGSLLFPGQYGAEPTGTVRPILPVHWVKQHAGNCFP